MEGAVDCVSREEEVQALNEIKSGKACGPSDVSQCGRRCKWKVQ